MLTLLWEFHHLAHLPCRFCQICSCPSRIGQTVEVVKVNKNLGLTSRRTMYVSGEMRLKMAKELRDNGGQDKVPFLLRCFQCTCWYPVYVVHYTTCGVWGRLSWRRCSRVHAPIHRRMRRANKPFMAIMGPPEALKSKSS